MAIFNSYVKLPEGIITGDFNGINYTINIINGVSMGLFMHSLNGVTC